MRFARSDTCPRCNAARDRVPAAKACLLAPFSRGPGVILHQWCPSPIRTCWHVPAFGRFVLTSIAYGSTIIQSFCRWASLRTFLSVVAATPGSFLLLRASSELPLIPRDRKPELVTCLTAHAVASVLPHLLGIAQTRKLSKFVHCTLGCQAHARTVYSP